MFVGIGAAITFVGVAILFCFLGIVASFVGFVISGVLVLNHYHAADAAFCGVGEWASCNTVNRSAYSEVLGVPVALLGMLGFLAMAALATARLHNPRAGLGRMAPPLLSATSVAGLGMGAYLTFIELFVLHLVCLLCVASLLSFIIAVVALRKSLVLPSAFKVGRGRREAPADGD
jgi:uncharacterized membrane protein